MNLPNDLSFASRSSVSLSELKALQRSSQLGEQQKLRNDSFLKEFSATCPVERVGNFAIPLSPLRDRDLKELEALFHRPDIYNIEMDVNQMLLHLLPEPCWEDDAFEFLREFL